MQKYDLIVGFGCSFMQGGGFENLDIYKFLNNITDVNANILPSDILNFRYKNNFIAYLSELLNCEYLNLAESSASNDLLFDKIYEYFDTTDISNKKILVITQLTLYTRQYVYYNYLKKFFKLNRTEFSEVPFNNSIDFKPLHEYYTNFLAFIYNENNTIKNLQKNIELYTIWLKTKNVDTLWFAYDGGNDKFIESDNFMKFDGLNMGRWCLENKLRLIDMPNCPIPDLHLNLNGHKLIAEKIYNKIKNT